MDKKKIVILCAAVAATASFVTGLFVYFFQTSQLKGNEIRAGSGNYQDIQKYMEISDLEILIRDNFYQDVKDGALTDGTLKGMVEALGDPYSVYYTEDEYKEYNEKGDSAEGIGVSTGPYRDSGQLKVEKVYAGGPAEAAGVAEGDVIVAVDGVALADLDYESSANMLKGPSGTSITLTVISGGEPKEVAVSRGAVDKQYVAYTMLDEDRGIAEIVISEFSGNSVDQFKSAIQYLKDAGAQGVVIDVRGNMDGSVKDAISMLDEILPEGVAAYSVDKSGQKDDLTVDADYFDIPLVAVVDGNSAGAAEIFAGALQDSGRGMVVGSQTYGKGVIQTILDMPYSGGGVKLTTAVYYTPAGRLVNDGIAPDVPVDNPADTALTFETDAQLQQAIASLAEAMANGQ